ncbi:MAG: class II myosin [Chaenotheca gracillima]|nr:MAG: class II myosin [Chaenotheca gracillima]
MPVAPLPASAVRTLGSAQALTTPASLVKELIDNALDARASSVFVEVSPNTVDVVQVKDNGHGIAPEDRDRLGKRHCTSKIRGLEDLKKLGGTMLGFRGEALASAIELASSLTIITRTEGEMVGCKIVMNRSGEAEKKEPASHCVGTSVRVSGFMKALPVRREAALKSVGKTLAAIKTMIQTYALARPQVRFSLKIPRAKNEKGDWLYAPANNAGMAEAAMKVVGREATGQCSLFTHSETVSDQMDLGEAGEMAFMVEAFIPRPDADPLKISDKGHFIFVDSRPVSCSRNTLKQILSLYKSYLRNSMNISSKDQLKNPFICMNIQCPPGSYDPNVEPAKDDVVFESSDLVLSAVETFFEKIYGPHKHRDVEKNITPRRPVVPRSKGFELLLARKRPDGGNVESEQDLGDVAASQSSESEESAQETEQGPKGDMSTAMRVYNEAGEAAWKTSMYQGFDDEAEDSASNISPSRDKGGKGFDGSGVVYTNPWVFTKLGSATGPGRRNSNDLGGEADSPNPQLSTPLFRNASLPTNTRQISPVRRTHQLAALLPSPQTNSSPHMEGRSSSPTANGARWTSKDREFARRRYGNGAIDTWVQKSPLLEGVSHPTESRSAPEFFSETSSDEDHLISDDEGPQDSLSTTKQPPGVQFGPRGSVPFPAGAGTSMKPFRSPLQGPGEGHAMSFPMSGGAGAIDKPDYVHPDVELLLDYERRKTAAVRQKKQMLIAESGRLEASHTADARASKQTGSRSPHKSRYKAALASLSSPQYSNNGTFTSMTDEDIRKINGVPDGERPPNGLRTPKTLQKRVPLEKIPKGFRVHDLVHRLPADLDSFKNATSKIIAFDEYVRGSALSEQSILQTDDIKELEHSIRGLVKAAYQTENQQIPSIQLDLQASTNGR